MSDKKKILVVDDEPAVTFTISAFLNRMGPNYELIRAFDKPKALEILESQKPEVVLLDIDLYGINSGLEILDTINKKYKSIKPIVITGRAKDHREQIEKIGCFYFFEKPVNLQDLNDKIKDALGFEKTIKPDENVVLNKNPKAKLLFIAPSLHVYAHLCAIFDTKEMLNGAEYIIQVLDNVNELLSVLADYQPDIVLICDATFQGEQVLSLVELIKGNIKIKPKSVIVHGLFEKEATFEAQLRKKGVKRCIQNVMDNEEVLKMNRKLADAVAQDCIELGLVK